MTKEFSVRESEAFCRSQPRGEMYTCVDDKACALAQFGFPGVLSDNIEDADISCGAYAAIFARPNTFSALADRLSKMEA